MAADSGHLAFNRVPHCQVLDVDDSYSDIFGGEIICTCGCVCVVSVHVRMSLSMAEEERDLRLCKSHSAKEQHSR